MYINSNSVYTNSSYNLNFNIKHTFKNIIDNLKEHIGSLFNKSDEYYIISIKDGLNNIANILEVIPQLSIEFFDFLKIKKMLFYILENYDSLKSNNLKGFFDLISSFHKLLIIKTNYINSSDLKKSYQNQYNIFTSELRSARKDFHKNIYKRSNNHDDIMIEVSKILME